ncbi:Neuferricin [Trichinella murrelli]|uniref:Neuferricin n=1 Tax=Trichinella murrelli TaxID=144512 RepID=A0A0V0TJ00_9BILA|nr:Neuferricin [Trichinella murrelli]
MFYPKLVVVTTLQVFLISAAVSYYNLTAPAVVSSLKKFFDDWLLLLEQRVRNFPIRSTKFVLSSSKNRLHFFTKSELSSYDGSVKSKGLYLAILGRIYDVSRGREHYGPGGAYHIFAGRDATRAFVTGDLSAEGASDDLTNLSNEEIIAVQQWADFYDKEYELVGDSSHTFHFSVLFFYARSVRLVEALSGERGEALINIFSLPATDVRTNFNDASAIAIAVIMIRILKGTYYNSDGNPTRSLEDYKIRLNKALKWKQEEDAEAERFPPCNSEWIQGGGGRVWCSHNSGGVKRRWAGVPRKLLKPGSKHSRCVCVKNDGTFQKEEDNINDEEAQSFSRRGDFDHPNLLQYSNCDPEAVSFRLTLSLFRFSRPSPTSYTHCRKHFAPDRIGSTADII